MDNIEHYLREAYLEATKSPDPSNQNGAVLVELQYHPQFCQMETIVGRGYNTFPPEIPITNEMLYDRDTKLFFIEHAERYCLFNATRNKANFEKCTMYTSWGSCCDCARAIGLMGVKKMVVHKQRMDTTPERWRKSIDAGLDFLSKLGVELEFYNGPISGCPDILVNGSKWNPNNI